MFVIREAYQPPIYRPSISVGRISVGADVSASGGQLLDALRDAVGQLNVDVAADACSSSYGPGCRGVSTAVDALERRLGDAEASGTVLDAKIVLNLASVDPSDENVAKFGKCVKKREDAFGRVDRGTLAFCAVQIRDEESGGVGLPPAHTTLAWRDRWETWRRMFLVFVDKYESSDVLTGKPSDAEVSKYLAKYMDFRTSFVNAGGETTAPTIDEPWSITTKVLVYGGIAIAAYMAFQLFLLRRTVGAIV